MRSLITCPHLEGSKHLTGSCHLFDLWIPFLLLVHIHYHSSTVGSDFILTRWSLTWSATAVLRGSKDVFLHVLTHCYSISLFWFRNWLMLHEVSLPWNSESSLFICRYSYMTFSNAIHLHMKVSFFPFQ